jgi:hypothetical protein
MKNLQHILILSLLIANYAKAQYVPEANDSTQKERLVAIEMKTGEQIVGYLISEDDTEVKLRTEKYGVVTLKWREILSIKDIDQNEVNKEGVYYKYNLQCTRYFFGPSGFGLKKGEGYYQNVWVFFNQASYGFTDYFSASVGTVPFFLFGGPTPVWIVPKVSIPIIEDKLNIGAGAMMGTVLGEDVGFAIPFGTFTYGNRNSNISASIGYGMADGEWSSDPTITISGMLRVSQKTYLITENYFFPAAEVSLITIGARSFAGKIGIDYGLVLPFEYGDFGGFVFPWLGLTVPFGKY